MSQTQPPSSKLFIRSEVLAVISYLNTVDEPSKLDKMKQIKRLQNLEDQETVQSILVKELQRATINRIIQIISELLIELGTITTLKAPLWSIIQNPKSPDEIKDAANVVLRQLGDASDPNLYLEYLDDPAGLINRETERMLEISSRNPEALIDFIDFIFSLPVAEQCNLIRSLQTDYPTDYLLNIFLPAILALPPVEAQELLLSSLAELRSKRSALFLAEHQHWFNHDPHMAKVIKRSINALKISGFYREDSLEEARQELAQAHPLVAQSTLYQCFATIPDGIGNQGIVISRERDNGDIVMMSVAINDLHGIIDCFGFYELSKTDFHKLLEKFHEENTKIHTPYAYCIYKLRQAEAINHRNHFRIPYEYGCWQILLSDPEQNETAATINPIEHCREWANPEWTKVSGSLYQHPDFSTWFLEEGDHEVVTAILENVLDVCAKAMANLDDNASEAELAAVEPAFLAALEQLANEMVHGLLATEWKEVLTQRLSDAAYLLNEQKAGTFSGLAATEVVKLLDYEGPQSQLTGFIRHYGRRCIEEDLLRLKQGAQTSDELKNTAAFEYLVDRVLTVWEL